MTPIVFAHIARMSDETVTDDERDSIAEVVFDTHGVDGLMTLWACQDYYQPEKILDSELTPATAWWLQVDNPYAKMIREKLCTLPSQQALDMLRRITFPPEVKISISDKSDPKHMSLYAHEAGTSFSNASATTVMQLAKQFFPQYPELLTPQCALYLDVEEGEDPNDGSPQFYSSHARSVHAFAGDATAMQYLLRMHVADGVPREDVTPEMEALLSQTDAEWEIFDSMGIDPEEAYHLIKGKRFSEELPLPKEFDISS